MQKSTLLLLIYILCLHVVLAVIIVKLDAVQRLARKLGWLESSYAEHYRRMLAFHCRMDASVPDNAVLFIGDSFIQGMCVSAIVDKAVNFGIGGDGTAGLLRRLPMYASIKRARAVVLAAGCNDLREREDSQIVKNYREILAMMPENITVLVCSLLPIDERCRQQRFNNRIIELNRSIAEMCSSIENCHFVDLTEKLKDAEGNLSDNCHEGDGIHLDSKGYCICNEILMAWLAQV